MSEQVTFAGFEAPHEKELAAYREILLRGLAPTRRLSRSSTEKHTPLSGMAPSWLSG